MKKAIIVLLLFLPWFSYSQSDSTVFFLNTDTKVNLMVFANPSPVGQKGVLVVMTKSFHVFQTGSDQYYVEYSGPDKKVHRKYLGWLCKELRYEDMSVFSDKERTKFWYLQIGDDKLPYKVELPDFVFK